MGRVSRRGPLLGIVVAAACILAGCASPLQSFIFDMLFGPPYRREMAKLVPTPNAGSFGFAVDITGDYMMVGEPGGDGGKGRAWIYHRTSGETWDSGTLLPAPADALGPDPSNANDGDLYGYAVATDGSRQLRALASGSPVGVQEQIPSRQRGHDIVRGADAARAPPVGHGPDAQDAGLDHRRAGVRRAGMGQRQRARAHLAQRNRSAGRRGDQAGKRRRRVERAHLQRVAVALAPAD